jgi:hypothetical protein
MSNHGVIAIDNASGSCAGGTCTMSNHGVIAIDNAPGSWCTWKVHP